MGQPLPLAVGPGKGMEVSCSPCPRAHRLKQTQARPNGQMLPWLVRCVDPGPLLSPDMGSSPAWLWEGHSEHGARWCIALHSCGDISPAGACRRLDPGAFHTRFSPAATKSQVTRTRALQFAAITAHGTDSSLQVLGVSPGCCPPGTWGIMVGH